MGGFSSGGDALLDLTPAQAGDGLGIGKHEEGGAAGADSLLDLAQPEEGNADKKPGMDNKPKQGSYFQMFCQKCCIE